MYSSAFSPLRFAVAGFCIIKHLCNMNNQFVKKFITRYVAVIAIIITIVVAYAMRKKPTITRYEVHLRAIKH